VEGRVSLVRPPRNLSLSLSFCFCFWCSPAINGSISDVPWCVNSNIEDVTEQLKVQIFHQEANQMATRDDLLGSVALALSSLQLSTDGTPVVQWYGLKRGRTKLKSRLRLKLAYVAKVPFSLRTNAHTHLAVHASIY